MPDSAAAAADVPARPSAPRIPMRLRRLNSDIRLSRHYGISNIIVMHALSDVDKIGDTGTKEAALARGLVSMCDTRIVLRQAPGEMARTRIRARSLRRADPGEPAATAAQVDLEVAVA